ncbi:MAG TPA: isochorismatase family cysteine hydrolase [Mycobacteriales bacterium]|nr:isochorismatase family cysteine hydrolase [Mycobacteriales bacterium]
MSTSDTALLVIDMQNAFCHPAGSIPTLMAPLVNNDAVLERNVEALARARAAGLPVIFTRHCWDHSMVDAGLSYLAPLSEADQLISKQMRDSGALVQGSWDADVVEQLTPETGEFVIDKPRYDAFLGTRLEQLLRGLGTEKLIVTGVVTNICVESTVRSGYMRDYRMTVAADCVTAQTERLHANALEAMDLGRFAQVQPLDEISGLPLPAAVA